MIIGRVSLQPPACCRSSDSHRSSAPPPEDALVRVEPAVALEEPPPPPLRPRRKGTLVNSGETVAIARAASTPLKAPRAQAVTDADSLPNGTTPLAAASPSVEPRVMRALPVTSSSPAVALTSTTGATWKTFAPGAAPAGRVLDTAGLQEVANSGTRGERVYLKGQFVVNFADANRAVLRPTSGQSGGLGAQSARHRQLPSWRVAAKSRLHCEPRRRATLRDHRGSPAIRWSAQRLRPRNHQPLGVIPSGAQRSRGIPWCEWQPGPQCDGSHLSNRAESDPAASSSGGATGPLDCARDD